MATEERYDDDASDAASGADFDAWVAARVADLTRFAYVVTGSQDAAEDAVQAALTKAYEHWGRVRQARDPDAYVRRMVVNAHISWWRRFRRREVPVDEVRLDGHGVDPGKSVSEADLVWRLCATLPSRQRAAVVLRYYEGLTNAEIADVLRRPEATIRSDIHRALAQLRVLINEEAETDG